MFKRRYIALSMLLLFFLLIHRACANDNEDVNLSEIPQKLAEKLSIPVFASQLLCASLVFLMLILPVVIIVRSKIASWIPEVVCVFGIMGFLVAIEWLPIWFVLIVALLTALIYGDRLRKKEEPY